MTLDGYNLIACFSHALINLQLDEPTQANGRITESRTAPEKSKRKTVLKLCIQYGCQKLIIREPDSPQTKKAGIL